MADDPQMPRLLPVHASRLGHHLFSRVCQRLSSLQQDDESEAQAQALVEAAVASTSALLNQGLLYSDVFIAALQKLRPLDAEEAELGGNHSAAVKCKLEPALSSSESACVLAEIPGGMMDSAVAADTTDAVLHFRVWFEAWEACAREAFNERRGAQVGEILRELMPNLSYLWLFAIKNLVDATRLVHSILMPSSMKHIAVSEAADEHIIPMEVESVAKSEAKFLRPVAADAIAQSGLGDSFGLELENLETNLRSKLGSFAVGMGIRIPQDDIECYSQDAVRSWKPGNDMGLIVERARAISCCLHALGPEIGGAGGLKAPRWRARAMAAHIVTNLAQHEASALTEKTHKATERGPGLIPDGLVLYEKLLHHLVYGLALSDSQWQVRQEAVESSAKIMMTLQPHIKQALFFRSTWGILAAMEDRQTEVRDAAVKAIMLVICPHSLDCDMTILGLINEFVAVASVNAEGDNTYNKKLAGRSDFDSFPEAKAIIAGLTGAVRLQLLPVASSEKGRMCSEHDANRVPLIVAAASAALEKSERTNNRSLSVSLEALLRELSLSGYSETLLAMLHSNGPSCTGTSIAEYYRKTLTIEHETLNLLEKLPKVVLLNGLSLALEGLGSNNSFPKNFSETSSKLHELAQKEFEALHYIVEALQIPSHLTNRYKETVTELDGEAFIVCAYPLLRMAKHIMSYPLWLSLENQDESKLVEQLILCCAALASADKVDEVLWTTKKLQELATSVASCLSKALHCIGKIDSLNVSVNNVHDLVLPYIPAIVPRLKQMIKGSLANEENLYTVPNDGSLKDAIVSAHQMHWIIKQVKHPHLGPHIDIVLPCVLTALDHPSPLIKRQAMKTFICLVEALNPSELKWYKDVILDAICRNLIGSDELWEVAVKMAVPLVTCIEGRNPRGFWYRKVLDNMLGEMERHSEDQQRRILWLQTIGPLLESMGLVLVVHFKRLLPLLFYWLHLSDDATSILVLSIMQIIIKQTWPRIPFHTSRILAEVIHAYKSSQTSKYGAHIHALAVDVCKLLQRSGKPQFRAAWEKYQNDSGMESLVSALNSFDENVKAEADK